MALPVGQGHPGADQAGQRMLRLQQDQTDHQLQQQQQQDRSQRSQGVQQLSRQREEGHCSGLLPHEDDLLSGLLGAQAQQARQAQGDGSRRSHPPAMVPAENSMGSPLGASEREGDGEAADAEDMDLFSSTGGMELDPEGSVGRRGARVPDRGLQEKGKAGEQGSREKAPGPDAATAAAPSAPAGGQLGSPSAASDRIDFGAGGSAVIVTNVSTDVEEGDLLALFQVQFLLLDRSFKQDVATSPVPCLSLQGG